MKSSYRINVRFDLRKEREKDAADYLVKLSEKGGGTRNRFIIDAVIQAIQRQQSGTGFTLDDIRAAVREELKSVSFISTPTEEQPSISTELTEEEKKETEANVLSALAMFD